MNRLWLIFFVVFSSNIFCLKISSLAGFFPNGIGMFTYSPGFSNYEKVTTERESLIKTLNARYPEKLRESDEYLKEKHKIDSSHYDSLYAFNLELEGNIKVGDLVDFFVEKYKNGETIRRRILVNPSNSGFDINNYKFERIGVTPRNDKNARFTLNDINAIVPVKDDCTYNIIFSRRDCAGSGPSGSDGKKSSRGCSCKRGKN